MEHTEQLIVKGWMVETRHYWIEILRMLLGGLMFYKGYYFVENIQEIYGMIEDTTLLSPFVVAHYVVFAHLTGGLMLAFGVLTRIAAIVQVPVLLGAIFFVHGEEIFFGPQTEMEYAFLVLILLIVFFFYGGGKWSVDYRISKTKEDTELKGQPAE